MSDAQMQRLIEAIRNTGSTNLLFVILLAFIASYLGWIALRLREINDSLKALRGASSQPTIEADAGDSK